MTEEGAREILLSALRCASLRAKEWDETIIKIGKALKDERITPEFAITWLREIGGLDWIDATTIGLVTKDDTPIGME